MVNKINKGYMYEILRNPIITEKSTKLAELNKFVFEVAPFATKNQIKQAVEALFEVNVVSVNMVNLKGKVKTFKGVKGRRNNIKKAIVSLQEGQNIDIGVGA